MNGKKAKEVRRKGKKLLVEWLQSVVPEENKEEITIDNIRDYLADQTHVYLNRKYMLSAFSLKWVYKRVKRNPNITLEDLKKDIK